MRFQLIIFLLLLSSSVLAVNDKSMQELFGKYDQIMDEKKVGLVEEVFSKKFLRESGGKDDFISKVKALPMEKNSVKIKVNWRKGAKDQIYFAKITPVEKTKGFEEGPEFIIIEEDGKLKIDGTLSDGD